MASFRGSDEVTVRPAKLPSSLMVTICHVESPSLFFVYTDDKRSEHLDTQLNIFMEEYGALLRLTQPPSPGTFVVCRFSKDDRYYRAVVRAWPVSEQHKPGHLLAVHYLDYGNSEVVRWKEGRLFRLWHHFADMAPVLAIPCAHYGIQPIAIGGWTEAERQLFRTRLSEFSNSFEAQLMCKFHWPPKRTRRGLQRTIAYVQLYRMNADHEMTNESSLTSVTSIGKAWVRSADCCYPLEMNIKSTLPAGFADLELICDDSSPYSDALSTRESMEGVDDERVKVELKEDSREGTESSVNTDTETGALNKFEVPKKKSEETSGEILTKRLDLEARLNEKEKRREEEEKESRLKERERRREEEERESRLKERERRREEEEEKESKRKERERRREEEDKESRRKERERRREEEERESRRKEKERRREEEEKESRRKEREKQREEEEKESRRKERERQREEEEKESRRKERERRREEEEKESRRKERERRREEESEKQERNRSGNRSSRTERRLRDFEDHDDRQRRSDGRSMESGDPNRNRWDDHLYRDGRSRRHYDDRDKRCADDRRHGDEKRWKDSEERIDYRKRITSVPDVETATKFDRKEERKEEEKDGSKVEKKEEGKVVEKKAADKEEKRAKEKKATKEKTSEIMKMTIKTEEEEMNKLDSKTKNEKVDRKEEEDIEKSKKKEIVQRKVNDKKVQLKTEQPTVTRKSERDEEEEECRSPSPITTLACTPPTLKLDFPFGSARFAASYEGLPELELPLREDGGINALAFHVESPSEFELCLVTKETSAMMQWLEKAMANHYSWVLSGQLVYMFQGFEPKVGTLVCAHHNDIFVRAVVLKTEYNPIDAKSLLVRCIDYGDKLWINLKAVYPLSPSMLAVPSLSLCCSLYGVAPVGSEWSEAAKSLFRAALGPAMPSEHATAQSLLAHLIDVHPGKALSTRQRVRVMLRTKENVLINVTLAEMKEPKVAVLTEEFTNVLEELRGKCEKKPVDPTDEAWNISHDIYRQSIAKAKDPTKHRSKATRVCEFFRVRGRCVWGQNCQFLHVRDTDEAAVNLNFERNINSTADVAFVDSGNHMDYPAVGAVIGLRVTTLYAPHRFYGQLLHGPGDYMERPDKSPALCDSSSRNFPSWAALMEAMTLHYNEETPRDLKDELYAAGEVVAARSPADKLWYRARVLDHDSSLTEVSVFFLDTGDVEKVDQMWVHPLLWTFLEGLPIQAFECMLHGVAMPKTGWTEEAFSTMRRHTDGRPLHARVEAINPAGTLQVTVWDSFMETKPMDLQSINDILLENDLAEPSKETAASAWICSQDPNFIIYPA